MLLALLLAATVPAHGGRYAVDEAHVLDPAAVQRLTAVAKRLDEAGIAQLVVATVPASYLEDLSLEDYAVTLFQKWGIGHGTKRDDGLLVLFVPGPPGQRKIRIEVGYGLEGILPDGKVGQIRTEQAFPYMKQDDYSRAAVHVTEALAAILEKDAAAGGDAAPAKDSARRGAAGGVRGYAPPANYGGLGLTIVCMGALAVVLASSAARRRFPGRKTRFAGAVLAGASTVSLFAMPSGPGWLALVGGLILNAVIWASIRAHKCPKDGSWMMIEQDILDHPTYWSEGLARVRNTCTNPRCGYRRQYDKVLPRRQRTVVVGGGGGGGGWGGGGGGGFSGGGGRSGGGGASGQV